MWTVVLVGVSIVMAAANLLLILKLLMRPAATAMGPELAARFDALERAGDKAERAVREEMQRSREESTASARQLREEVTRAIAELTDATLQRIVAFGEFQTRQLELFAKHLGDLKETSTQRLDAIRTASAQQLREFGDSLALHNKNQHETLAAHIKLLTDSNDKRFSELRDTVHKQLQQLLEDNAKKLDAMRATVDEKLQGTLEKRLGESFKIVSERLEQVHKGLGEMQSLASGVGDLKRVLTNVKTRGTWGEIQLESLLEQFLSVEQFYKNVAIQEHSSQRVEFAIRFPGRDGHETLLPIDAKFPVEDYQRLIEAHERCDAEAIDAAGRALEQRVKACAKDICDKYVHPPRTTPFGILYLPIEGLYAEVARRVGLAETLRRDCRVEIAGPNTLPALLSSFQMGFRTLVIEKRSNEVWQLLGTVKTEFSRYGEVLTKVQKKLQEASNTIDQAQTRTRVITRKLKNVQEATADSADMLLEDLASAELEAQGESSAVSSDT